MWGVMRGGLDLANELLFSKRGCRRRGRRKSFKTVGGFFYVDLHEGRECSRLIEAQRMPVHCR